MMAGRARVRNARRPADGPVPWRHGRARRLPGPRRAPRPSWPPI